MKILITGAAGTIGSVLMKGLSKRYQVIGIDKESSGDILCTDIVKDKDKVRDLLKDVYAVVHLAWDIKEGGVSLSPSITNNKIMGEIMYELSLETGVKKFILASSVHVSFGHIRYKPDIMSEDHQILHGNKITIHDEVYPLGVYGSSKAYLESLGKAYSYRGLNVIAARFGHVTPDDNFGEYPFWLSHRDCSNFIERCVETEDLPEYSTFFAVSNNACNPFDLSEAKAGIKYEPKDGSSCPYVGLGSNFVLCAQ